jgi:uncharacterized protein with ATP-grasp and redox domains
MKTYLDCISCFFRQGLEAARMVTDDEEKQRKVLDEIAKELPQIPLNSSPPEMGRKIHKIVQRIAGSSDPYKKIKDKYNKIALRLYPKLREITRKTKDPLLMSIRVAIAGNIIDFGVNTHIDIEQEIKQILKQDFAIFDYIPFKKALEYTDELLYLADNCGEVAFDRILIELITDALNKKVTYVVREKPIINDATIEDALFCGIDKVARIISSGSDGPGTFLSLATNEFRSYFNRAKLIISKGQGNYETLSEEDKPIFFLLKAKCPVIAKDLGCKAGDIVLKEQATSAANHSTSFKRRNSEASVKLGF